MRLAVGSGCVLVATTFASAAAAQVARPGFSLDYSAPSGCPERADFVASLVARSRGAHEATEGPRVLLGVSLDGTGAAARGALTVRLPDGQESRREIPEARCADVLASMSVIAAMILDGGGLDDAPPPVGPPRSAGSVSSAVAARQAKQQAEPFSRQEASESSPPADSVEDRASSSRRRRARLAARVGLGPQAGVAPTVVPRYFAGFGLTVAGAGGSEFAVDAMASIAESGREVGLYGDARFRLLAVTVNVCPWRWSISKSVALHPCVPVELGVLRGIGDNTVLEKTQYMPWWGAGAAARLDLALSRSFRLEVEAHATVLGNADRFVFEPDNVVHDVPRVAVGLWFAGVVLAP